MTLTDVVDGASTELAVELLGSQAPEVMNRERPEVKHIVAGECVSFFDHHHFTAQQRQLDGRPQTTRPAADDQTLNRIKEEKMVMRVMEGVSRTFSSKVYSNTALSFTSAISF